MKIVTSVAWSAADTWGRQLTLLLTFILLARYLGPEALGLAALAMSAPNFLSIPLQQGLPDALVQREEVDPLHFDSAFWFTVALGAALSALIFLSGGAVAQFFNISELQALVQWTSAIVLIRSLGVVPAAYLRRRMEFRLIAVRSLASTLFGGAVGIGMALSGYGVWSLIGLQLAHSICGSLVLLIFGDWRPRLRFQYARVHELFGFSIPVLMSALIYTASEEIPKILLGLFHGPAVVGIYTLARRILELFSEVYIKPLLSVVLPAVSRMQNSPEKISRFFRQAIIIGMLFGFPACLGFALIASDAVPLVFGKEWTLAVVSVQIIMLLGVLRIFDSISGFILISIGRSKLAMSIGAGYLAAMAMLALITARYGPEPMIAGITLLVLGLVPVNLFFLNKYCGIEARTIFDRLPRIALSTLIMAAALLAFRISIVDYHLTNIVSVTLSILVGMSVYAVSILLLNKQEVTNIRDLLNRLRNRGAKADSNKDQGATATAPELAEQRAS